MEGDLDKMRRALEDLRDAISSETHCIRQRACDAIASFLTHI